MLYNYRFAVDSVQLSLILHISIYFYLKCGYLIGYSSESCKKASLACETCAFFPEVEIVRNLNVVLA